MDPIIRNVDQLSLADRHAFERLLGFPLSYKQRLIIEIVDLDPASSLAPVGDGELGKVSSLPAWCNVYAGMGDDEIEDLERTILNRVDLTRP